MVDIPVIPAKGLGFKAGLFRFILCKVMGWKLISGPAPVKQCVLLGVPHTSMWDFLVAFLFYASQGAKIRIVVKSTLFWWPLGWILRACGAIPVDRTNKVAMIRSVMDEMENSDTFHLAMAPEGTRKPVHKWLRGYHFYAKHLNIPVYLGSIDYKYKEVGIKDVMPELTDNAAADTVVLQQMYKNLDLHAKFPENYVTD